MCEVRIPMRTSTYNYEMYVDEVTTNAMREVGDWWSVPENRKLLEEKWKEYNERD
jgi:hypothetical protein